MGEGREAFPYLDSWIQTSKLSKTSGIPLAYPFEKVDFGVSSAECRRHGFKPSWDYQVKTSGYHDFGSLFSFVCIRFTYSDLIGMFPTDFFVDFLNQRDS